MSSTTVIGAVSATALQRQLHPHFSSTMVNTTQPQPQFKTLLLVLNSYSTITCFQTCLLLFMKSIPSIKRVAYVHLI